jgi:diguanylate cyclase (GGDEF)-like protein
MTAKGRRASAFGALRHGLSHATEPHILFPAAIILVLGMIWGTTLNLIRVEHGAAEHAALAESRELGETYEAQVVRALREIDQALKFVQYAYERSGKRSALLELKSKGLLPPDLVFVVAIADGDGDVVASTRPLPVANVVDQDYFQSQRVRDSFMAGRPWKDPRTLEWKLTFSRRLAAADGGFAGIVMITVEAQYFTSGYETSMLGEEGALGIVGTDGIFRALRSGEVVLAGDLVDYKAVVPVASDEASATTLSISPWDGVLRYTTARQLYEFPLAVIVGLSAGEQLALSRRHMQSFLWRAAGASLLLLLVMAILWRMSQQLALSRRRAVEEHIEHSKRVEFLAYHDGLTGLPNRGLFSKLLAQSISQAHRHNRQLAVLFLDLDRFKHINDTLGHEAGDQLLKEVATRLKACLRDSDTVARLGGDEFVALLPELQEEKYVATVAQKILAAAGRPFLLLGQDYRVTASVGISTYPQDGLDEQTLTKNADIAMYQAKSEGKNNFQFYSEKLNANSLERLTLEAGLRHAMERGEFELHYQAKRAMGSNRITGVEALLRWQHPDVGTVAPMKFIPVAEETGLIIPIGNWVLRTACLQNVAWQQQGLPHLSMSVNLTARQFSDENLLPTLSSILAETGMDAHLLELEIPESLLMRDVDKALRILTRLRDMRIRIAIDDFGVGYSSLSKLKRFPLDTVKIDRSYIRDVASAEEGKELAEAMIALGRTLSLTVVAQGVETREQADFLQRNACDEFQGFYLNKPVPGDQISELLRKQMETAASAAIAAA